MNDVIFVFSMNYAAWMVASARVTLLKIGTPNGIGVEMGLKNPKVVAL
jgi:hypothetical protein